MNDKRALFFLLVALVCLALAPASPDEFRTVTLGVATTYALLALASFLDSRSRR